MAKILISGIPGTGKTTVAEYLVQNHGYLHVDMEAELFEQRRRLKDAPEEFLGSLADKENVVLSWGFGPFQDRPDVEKLLAAGYQLFWLDGDHVVALKNFLQREDHNTFREGEYYGQMMMILATGIVERLAPTCVDPFKGSEFRPIAEIAAEILQKAAK